MLSDAKREQFRQALRRQRAAVFKTVAGAEDDLGFITEDRESELEERAQEERTARLAARLDDRGKQELWEIDAALRRIAEGTYGVCARCGKRIPLARLEALPAALHCVDCARDLASAPETSAGGEEPVEKGRLPSDLRLLGDRELAEALRELVRADGRVDMEELRLTCRHGVVYLTGTLPSEAEHQILGKLLTDVEGLTDVVDRVRVTEVPWEREDRAKGVEPPREETPRRLFEPARTEDIVQATEEGVDYEPPAEPPPEEE
jgi:DnaK suppressor protein